MIPISNEIQVLLFHAIPTLRDPLVSWKVQRCQPCPKALLSHMTHLLRSGGVCRRKSSYSIISMDFYWMHMKELLYDVVV